MHNGKTAPTCLTLQVTDLKGPWLLFPVPSLFKTHCCSQEKQTKPNNRQSVCSLKKGSLGTVLSPPASFRNQPISPGAVPRCGCAGGQRSPSPTHPDTRALGREHTRPHNSNLCSPETSAESSPSSREEASVFRLVCHTQRNDSLVPSTSW